MLNVCSKGEGFARSIMLLHALFTGLIYFEEKKKNNLLTKSDGFFSLGEFFNFAINRVVTISDEIVFLRNHLPTNNFYL